MQNADMGFQSIGFQSIESKIKDLLSKLEQTQYMETAEERHQYLKAYLNDEINQGNNQNNNKTIKTREYFHSLKSHSNEIKNIKEIQMISRTSGSTGQPVVVPKTLLSHIWFCATTYREIQWRNWDMALSKAVILARNRENYYDDVLNAHFLRLAPFKELQTHLETIQPHYIITYPSILQSLDLSKLSNFKDARTMGEIGATSYSSEETGTIALMCQFGKYHIMENIVVETDPQHGILITDLTNPHIIRYALGDHIVIDHTNEQCQCGRKLPIISEIKGRTRGMLVLPNNDHIWPTIGEPYFSTITDKIIQHQAVQVSLYKIILYIKVRERLTPDEENNLIQLVELNLNNKYMKYEIEIVYKEEFETYKFEAFKTLITGVPFISH